MNANFIIKFLRCFKFVKIREFFKILKIRQIRILELCGRLSVPAMNFTINVDDHLMALYFDGVQVPNTSLPNAFVYSATDTVILPSATRVIAIYAWNEYGAAGLLASTADGRVVTSCDWRCTDSTPPSDWMMVDFDDNDWEQASAEEQNNDEALHYEKYMPNINNCSYWIWSNFVPESNEYYFGFNAYAYCRLKLFN